jgi:hypothetical protein
MIGEEVLLTGSKTYFPIRLVHSHHFENNVLHFHIFLCEVRNLVSTSYSSNTFIQHLNKLLKLCYKFLNNYG